jgi:hypothetical protein
VPLWQRSRLFRRRIAEGVEVPLGEAGDRVEEALFLRDALRELPQAPGPYRVEDGVLYVGERAVARATPELAAELADLLNRQTADDASRPRRAWPAQGGARGLR